ncbi:hypothetical protein TNCV_2136371, partial [Trichonephila clavipes]
SGENTQISPSRVELAARNRTIRRSPLEGSFISIAHRLLYDGRVHERRESRYDSGVRGHRLQWSNRSEVVRDRPPVRRTPAHTMFARLHQHYVRPVHSRRQHVIEIGHGTYQIEREIVLDMVETAQFKYTVSPSVKSGFHTVAFGGFSMIVSTIHFTTSASSHKECDFCTSSGLFTVVLAATDCKSLFAASVLFTDEASFERIFSNTHNTATRGRQRTHM